MMIESVSDINSTSPSQHKPRGKKGSSASSQGSARSHRSEARRDTSSSSDQSDEERKSKSKRRVQRRRPPAFSTEEDDDERTDSADEGGDALKGSQSPPPMTHTSFYNQYSSSTFSQPILKPLSPISLQVGYGSDLIHAGGRAGGGVLNNALDLSIVPSAIESDERRGETVAVIDSGVVDSSPQSVHHHDPESPVNDERLSPEVSIVQGVSPEQDPRPAIPTLPPKPVTIATAGSSSVLPSPSLGPPTTNTALPFAGWGWGQPTLYSPFCATSGSVAGTPAVTDGLTPSLTSGTNTYLQAAICQELDGVLVVNVRWRNKTFSGSLIDVQHHKWAPPRLSDAGVPDMTLKLKDLLGGSGAGGGAKVSADSEKDSVDVEAMEDQPRENGDQQNRDDSKESSIIAMETSDSTNIDREQSKLISDRGQFTEVDAVKSSHLNGEHSLSSDQTSSPLRQSNGLHHVPSITGGAEDKTKTGSSLPPFDAVKSPQPQLALDEKVKPKETSPPSNNPPSVLFPPTVNSVIVAGGGGESKMAADNHVNFHTLVDVAASMKPVHDEKGVVSSDDTLSDKETSSDCLKSTLAYHPDDHGLHLHGNRGEDSDSSGSGSLSPVKKKVPHRKVPVVSTPSVVKDAKEDGKQMELSFNSASFLNNHQIPPISPGDHASGHAPTHSAVIEKEMLQPQPPKVIKGQFWSPASVNSTIGKELDSRFPPNVDTSNPSAHFPPHALAHYSDMPPGGIMIPGNPPHTVIQDKGKGLGGSSRKRKPDDSSSHKHQMSPPTNKDIDSMRMMSGKPLPPLPSSFKTGKPSDPSVIMQPGGIVQSQGDGKSVPDGFVYEPSLPMSREYQIIAYERERQKAAEEKLKAEGSGLPKVKRPREQHDHRHASSPSPPSSFKKDRIHHQPSVIPPGVVVSDHMIHRHMGGIVSHSPQIKQEHRPSRPPSKPGHHHHSSSSGGSSSSKVGGPSQPDKKRPHQSRKDGAIISGASIKKEPEQIQQWLPPGSLPPTSFVPIAGGMAQPTILNLPPGLSISSPSHLPPSFSAQYNLQLLQPNSALVPPPPSSKPKDSIHSRARQTPSPNPKKPHEWQPHGFSGHPHVITPTPTKPEHGSSRHGQLPGEGKSQGGGGHLRMPHTSSRHKQDGGGGGGSSSSSRSIPPHSHPPQPSPTHSSLRNGIAATPILTAGGVPTTSEEFMKLNLLQLEALKNSGGAGLTFQSPQDFLTWQAAARAGQLSAMGIPQSNEAAFQMQLLAQQQMAAAAMAQQQHQQQQQQQQQQNEAAMANFQQALAASQGMPAVIPFMQPFPLATPTGVFTIPPPPPNKRDS